MGGVTAAEIAETTRRSNNFVEVKVSDKDSVDPTATRFVPQASKMGDPTDRIYDVAQTLNATIGNLLTGPGDDPFQWRDHPRRNVIWHSDESARPGAQDVSMPVVAFAPDGNFYCMRHVQAFRAFISWCDREKIQVTLSSSWTRSGRGFLLPTDGTQSGGKPFGERHYRHGLPAREQLIPPKGYNN